VVLLQGRKNEKKKKGKKEKKKFTKKKRGRGVKNGHLFCLDASFFPILESQCDSELNENRRKLVCDVRSGPCCAQWVCRLHQCAGATKIVDE